MTRSLASKLIEPFGVEIDPALILRPSEAGTRHLRQLFDQHGLILIRGLEPMSMERQMEVCSLFGPVLDNPWENMIVSNSRPDGYLGAQQLMWHNDLPYLPTPYIGGSLHALEVDDGTTTTHFANAMFGYDRLPQTLKDRVAGLTALHVKLKIFDRRNRLTDLEAGDICSVHPVVRKQRNNGQPYLFVCEQLTDSIIGMSPRDSDGLLDELFGYLYAPGETYEHRWQLGDIVIWDNETVQHSRGEITEAVRTLQRVSIAEIGYARMYPTDLGIFSDQYDAALADGTGATKNEAAVER